MALELEGDLSLERAHTRRWVSIIAVIIPVAAFVLLGAWFIRAYIVPPTVSISNVTMLAEAPPPPPAIPKRAQVEAPPPPMNAPMATAERNRKPPVPSPALPMFATLSAAPPAMDRVPPAYADPVQETPAVAPSIMVAEPVAEIEHSEPLT